MTVGTFQPKKHRRSQTAATSSDLGPPGLRLSKKRRIPLMSSAEPASVQRNRKFLRDARVFRDILQVGYGLWLSLVERLNGVQEVPGSNPGSPIPAEHRNRMNSHTAIDARSLAMDRLIAQRLRETPAVLDKARSVLAKWMTSCDASVRPVFEEWRAILDGPISGVFAVLEGVDERSTRLRQSSPFCGILTPAERTAILMSHWRRQRTSRRIPLPLEHLTENTEHAV